ncbi:MAG: chemotaxis protein CheW [Promethearchaeota archaeon]
MSYSFLNSKDIYETERKAKQFILFTLNNNLFGLPIEQTTQIGDFRNIFPVPGTPDYVLGVMNSRGKNLNLMKNLSRKIGYSLDLSILSPALRLLYSFKRSLIG